VALWVCVLLLFLAGFLLVMHRHDQSSETSASSKRYGGGPVTVTVATAKTGDIGQYVEAIGTVTPVFTDSITSQVSGAITAVHYDEGQLVEKGDPLIDIDARQYLATLLQAQGALQRDQNLLAEAQMDLDRYQKAWARNAIPRQTLDDQEKLVLQDQGTVKYDQGLVDYDQVQVDYCHITAPISGRVGLRLVDQGNVVQSTGTQTLVVITQIAPITVVFTISEDSIDLVESHMKDGTKLTVDAFDRTGQQKIGTGTLLTLDNQIDTTTGTVKARAVFPNKRGALFPNQFVNARLLVNTFENVTLIPSSAVQHNGQTSFVYVIQDETAHMQNVTPGVTEGLLTQVTGISAGDVVANSGFEKLQDKAKVTIAKESTTEPSTTEPSHRRHAS
jgi:multidrug efflux system membrane fusion protein